MGWLFKAAGLPLYPVIYEKGFFFWIRMKGHTTIFLNPMVIRCAYSAANNVPSNPFYFLTPIIPANSLGYAFFFLSADNEAIDAAYSN